MVQRGLGLLRQVSESAVPPFPRLSGPSPRSQAAPRHLHALTLHLPSQGNCNRWESRGKIRLPSGAARGTIMARFSTFLVRFAAFFLTLASLNPAFAAAPSNDT